MPRKRPTYCLLVGDAEHTEFRSAVGWLAEQVQVTIHATPKVAFRRPIQFPRLT